ncbi:hypothetical protein GOBAR_DD24284 [Gossypium barbadense]|nr:hypothetical protein GOBAR_DD24284 [Gossypium barbadense]
MATKIGTLMVDVFATSHYTKSHLHKTHESNYVDEKKTWEHEIHLHVHTHATHGHAHGISSGASEGPNTIKPLVDALTFHRFFEGMRLEWMHFPTVAIMGLKIGAGLIGIKGQLGIDGC